MAREPPGERIDGHREDHEPKAGPAEDVGAEMRESGSNGLIYPSVRNARGQCVAAFRPKAVAIPAQTKHLKYHWDGTRVVRYFDYELDTWIAIETR